MTDWLQENYYSTFYGYVNGDILVHSSLFDILTMVSKKPISSHLLIVGRRYNTYVSKGFTETLLSRQVIDQFILDNILFNEQFIPVAQDYFIFSRSTFNRTNVLPVVIGRNRYDNYLCTLCKENPACALVDASNASIDNEGFFI